MRKINIPFRGMTNVPDDNFSQDGDMAVLMNMRHKGGELVRCQPPYSDAHPYQSQGEVIKAMYHPQSEAHIILKKDGKVYIETKKEVKIFGTDVKSFTLIGNIVVMYKEVSIEYAIWRDGKYVELEGLPRLPRLTVGIKPVHVTTLTDAKYYTDNADVSSTEEGLRWKNVSKGYFDECLNGLYQQGAFIDRTLVRLAARLFDGSYICYSPIYYVEDTDTLIENIGYFWLGQSFKIGRDNKNFFSIPHNLEDKDRTEFFTSVRGFIPSFKLENYNLENWRDIIVAIELFATPSIMGHETKKGGLSKEKKMVGGGTLSTNVELTTLDGYERYEWKGAKKIREEVADASEFYKIAEFDLEGKELWRLDETSPSQIVVQKQLPYNAQSTAIGSPEAQYVYNSKLHIPGTTEFFADAYENYAMPARPSGNITQITSVVTIDTEQGERRVVTNTKGPSVYKQGDDYLLPPLLHYPDARAKNLRIYVGYEGSAKYKDFPLTAHKSLNLAYFLNSANLGSDHDIKIETSTEGLYVDINSASKGNAFVEAVKANFTGRTDYSGTYVFTFTGLLWNLKVTFSSDKKTETKEDVSVYSFGVTLYSDAGILAIKNGDTITVTLDYGTGALAGLNPIEIKANTEDEAKKNGWNTLTTNEAVYETENGVVTGFTLKIKDNRTYTRNDVLKVSAVDNPFYFPTAQTYKFEGDIVGLASNAEAISTGQFGQYPLFVFTKDGIWAMAVDTSGKGAYASQSPFSREVCSGAICPVSGGIVFATERGLMAVSGGEVVELSAPLDGIGLEMLDWSAELLGKIAEKAGVSLENIVPIREYLNGAKIAYNYLHNEVIVSNSAKGYSYVYSIDNKEWSVIDTVFDVTTNSYPELVVYDNGVKKRYTFNDKNTDGSGNVITPGVVAITRPIKVDGVDFKRLRQAALRCTFDGSLNFYVLGSNDGATFTCITGKEFEGNTKRRDLVTAMSRSKQYKYIAVAVAGKMKGRISLAELLVDGSFANEKLR